MFTAELAPLLSPHRILTSPEDLAVYGFDGTAALSGDATCVVLPETVEEIAAIVRFAAARKIPIVSRGSGTGLSGGSIPVPGGIVLCLVRMDRILELDEKNLTLFAEAGADILYTINFADFRHLSREGDPEVRCP